MGYVTKESVTSGAIRLRERNYLFPISESYDVGIANGRRPSDGIWLVGGGWILNDGYGLLFIRIPLGGHTVRGIILYIDRPSACIHGITTIYSRTSSTMLNTALNYICGTTRQTDRATVQIVFYLKKVSDTDKRAARSNTIHERLPVSRQATSSSGSGNNITGTPYLT